jgi:hypothetical protein
VPELVGHMIRLADGQFIGPWQVAGGIGEAGCILAARLLVLTAVEPFTYKLPTAFSIAF